MRRTRLLFEDSIAAKYPVLAEEWHPVMNGKRHPREISFRFRSFGILAVQVPAGTYSGAELVLAPLPLNPRAVQSVVGSPGST